MLKRTINSMAYVTIVAVGLAGLFKLSAWAVVGGSASLALLSVLADTRTNIQSAHTLQTDAIQVGASSLNAAFVASAAFALGYASGWLWGV